MHGNTIFLLFPQLFLMALVLTGGAQGVLRQLSNAMIVERDVSRFTAWVASVSMIRQWFAFLVITPLALV